MTNLISFDWAMKRVLRDKANHAVLEGLMTSLLNEKFTIVRFLESESNQEDENDKFNRVDILAESEKGELTIFEIQNNRELAYFHRILYGVAKTHLDEWIRFLKTGEIEASDTAPGLADAKECLDVRKLSREELLVYQRHKMNEAYQRSVISTGYDDGMQDGIKKGRAEGRVEGIAEGKAEEMVEVAKKMLMARLPDAQIIAFTGLTQEQINRLKN